MAKKEEKTNAMRLLDQKKIAYTAHPCEMENGPEGDREYGLHIARTLGEDERRVFKTLVARGAKGALYVFVVPVAETLDLKKAARAVGEKSVELTAVKELPALTGYVRGGCSPLGMKKPYPTVFHRTLSEAETVFVSGGRIGMQIELSPQALLALTGGKEEDIISEG